MDPEEILSINDVDGRRLIIKKIDPFVELDDEDLKSKFTLIHPWFTGYVSVKPIDKCYKDVKKMPTLEFQEKYPRLSQYALGGITFLGKLTFPPEDDYYIGFDTAEIFLRDATEEDVREALELIQHEMNRMNEKEN